MMLLNSLSPRDEVNANPAPPSHSQNHPPPNHLGESQIFRKQGSNNLIKILPEKIHFINFQPYKPMEKMIKILNISDVRQRFHILPPQSKFFKIEYKKKEGPHVPGMAIPVLVKFMPSNWKTYSDCIRIHCPEGEDNLIIPLEAYPSIDTSNIPKRMDFYNAKLGQQVSKKFVIWSKCDDSVSFQAYLKEGETGSECFKLSPTGRGTIKPNSNIDFKILYCPMQYCTTGTELLLMIECGAETQEFSIKITGNCRNPDMDHQIGQQQTFEKPQKKLQQKKVLPKIQSSKNNYNRKITEKSNDDQNNQFLVTGLGSHRNRQNKVHTQHGVNHLLLHGVKDPSFLTHSYQPIETLQYKTYKAEENEFIKAMNFNKKLEQSCRVKWLERKGQSALTSDEKADIIYSRNQQLEQECYMTVKTDYQTADLAVPVTVSTTSVGNKKKTKNSSKNSNSKISLPNKQNQITDRENNHYKNIQQPTSINTIYYQQGRITHPANHTQEISDIKSTFSIYDSNDWWKRRLIRSRFQKAANTIILRNRADRALKILKLLGEKRMLKSKIEEEEKMRLEEQNKLRDPLQEMLDRLIPLEDSNYDNNLDEIMNSNNQNSGSNLEQKFMDPNKSSLADYYDNQMVQVNDLNDKMNTLDMLDKIEQKSIDDMLHEIGD